MCLSERVGCAHITLSGAPASPLISIQMRLGKKIKFDCRCAEAKALWRRRLKAATCFVALRDGLRAGDRSGICRAKGMSELQAGIFLQIN